MKLASRYSRTNLIISLLILCTTGLIYYYAIHTILGGKLDDDLAIEEQEIIAYTSFYGKLPVPADFKNETITYKLLPPQARNSRVFLDTTYWNPAEKEIEPGRTLLTVISLKNERFLVSISRSKVESEDLVRLIFFITLGILGFMLLLFFVVNRFLLKNLWQPFYTTLAQIKAFNVSDRNIIELEHSDIDEFTELNRAALAMVNRVNQEYTDLKIFTSNAAHEMMTPLAVMISLLDNLLQAGDYNTEQGKLLDELYQAIKRLQRLNESLVLLVRIENKLIKEQSTIDLKSAILNKAGQFKDFFVAKNTSMEMQLEAAEIYMSQHLLDILLNNLFSNALKHGHAGGHLVLELSKNQFCVKNTGGPHALEPELIFNRFYKQSDAEGLGLGLAICRQIARVYGFSLTYQFQAPFHVFTLNFNTSKKG